jgi:ketosteroid isomerase-like protein
MLWPRAITPKHKIMKLSPLFGTILFVGVALSCQAGFAQTSSRQALGLQNAPNQKIVRAYYTAFEKKDWNSMEQILATGFTFSSPVDDHIPVKVFKEKCWPNAYKIKRCDLVKMVVKGDEAFVIYNGWTTDGKFFRNCDYFQLKDGKIKTYECFFGPGINYPNSGK